MGISAWTALALFTFLCWFGYTSLSGPPQKPRSEFPPPLQVGKTRNYQASSQAAGMYTQGVRRKAIISNRSAKFGGKGSGNGSLEYYFLTGICVCHGAVLCPTVYEIDDGGAADAEVCDIIDGDGTEVLDFGNAETNVCDT